MKKNLRIEIIDKVVVKDSPKLDRKAAYGNFVVLEYKNDWLPQFNPLFQGVNTYSRPPTESFSSGRGFILF
jgi:hypothetical protein